MNSKHLFIRRCLRLALICLTSYVFCLLSLHACAQQGQWTWMKGDSIGGSSGIWGIQGVANAANTPPGLYEATNWTDLQGNFWLFGGLNFLSLSEYDALWKFDPTTNNWTWIKGPNTFSQSGIYGTQGVPDINNNPGGRAWGSASWVDSAGMLWLFGGKGYDANGTDGALNDLWKYDIATNEWTWMKGSSVVNSSGNYGTMGIETPSNDIPSRWEACGTWTGNNNYLWLFGGLDYSAANKNDLWRYNINTNHWTWMKGSSGFNAPSHYGIMNVEDSINDPGGRWIYSRWIACNGDLLFFGGWSVDYNFWNDVWKFDIATTNWVWLHGDSLTNQGTIAGNYCEFDSSFVPHSRGENKGCWRDQYGKLWFFGGFYNTYDSGLYNDLWVYDPAINKWALMSGSVNGAQEGFYGQQQIYNPANVPQSKDGTASWTDTAGNFWIFGGYHYNLYAGLLSTNDLWRYVPDYTCIGTAYSCQSFSPFLASDTTLCEKFCVSFTDQSNNNPFSWQWLFPGGDPSTSTEQNPTNICYDVPGTYDVTLITTNANGNDTLTLSNYITVYPTPPFPTITQVGYTLTSSPASSYQWQNNSIDIPGATDQSYIISQSGYYTVIVSDSNGCQNSQSIKVFLSGIASVESDTNISIYPNPSSGSFTIELINEVSSDEVSIEVTNTLGQKVFSSSEKVSNSVWKKEIDLCSDATSGTCSGVYFIEIKTRNVFTSPGFIGVRKKIIIMK